MQFLPRPSSKAISAAAEDRLDPTLPVILEYQSPSTAIVNLPMPRIARGFTLTLSSMIAVLCVVTGVIQVDRVVTAPGIVVAKGSTEGGMSGMLFRQMAIKPSTTASATCNRSEFGICGDRITAHQALFASPWVCGRVKASDTRQIASATSEIALEPSNGPLSRLAWR